MLNLLSFLAEKVIIVLATIGLIVSPLGLQIPETPGLYDGFLASGISKTDTSFTLSTGLLQNGEALDGFICFTIDVGTPTVEFVCGTASSTAVTSVVRGISLDNPNTTSSAYTYKHRRFASVQITDFPVIQLLARVLQGTDAIQNIIKYKSTTPTCSAANDICDKTYIDAIVNAGAADATDSVEGISMFATQAEMAAGTATSSASSTFGMVPQNRFFNATPGSTTTVVVTEADGDIAAGFIGQDQAYTWTAAHSFSAGVTSTGAFVQTAMATFSAAVDFSNNIPTIPTSTPTSDDEVVSKKYADDTFFNFSTSSAVSRSLDTDYQNTTGDYLFVSVSVNAKVVGNDAQNEEATATGKIGVSTSTYFAIAEVGIKDTSNQWNSGETVRNHFSFSMIVPTDFYYTVTKTIDTSDSVGILYWTESY